MVKLLLTVKIIGEGGSINISDTFTLPLDKEDITDIFLDNFASFAIDPQNQAKPQEIQGDEIRTLDEVSAYANQLNFAHDIAPGNIIDWRILKSKTKITSINS